MDCNKFFKDKKSKSPQSKTENHDLFKRPINENSVFDEFELNCFFKINTSVFWQRQCRELSKFLIQNCTPIALCFYQDWRSGWILPGSDIREKKRIRIRISREKSRSGPDPRKTTQFRILPNIDVTKFTIYSYLSKKSYFTDYLCISNKHLDISNIYRRLLNI